MVYNDRPTYKDRHAAQLIMARRDDLHSKAEYIAADLSIAPKLSLAVLRRTIHYQDSVCLHALTGIGRVDINALHKCGDIGIFPVRMLLFKCGADFFSGSID